MSARSSDATVALRVLSVEDSADATELARLALIREGFQPTITRGESAAELESALDRDRWDVVLSDHSQPGFSSTDALTILSGISSSF